MFSNYEKDIIENNAYGIDGYFIPIDTCGELILVKNLLYLKNNI